MKAIFAKIGWWLLDWLEEGTRLEKIISAYVFGTLVLSVWIGSRTGIGEEAGARNSLLLIVFFWSLPAIAIWRIARWADRTLFKKRGSDMIVTEPNQTNPQAHSNPRPHTDKAQKLAALANDPSASIQERITALEKLREEQE